MFVLLFVSVSFSETLIVKPLKVIDGDTLYVKLTDNSSMKIRLYGVDTPETKQTYGPKAKQFTELFVKDKSLTVNSFKKDIYGRTIAEVLVDGKSLNASLIETGNAWVYTAYCKREVCKNWMLLQEAARQNKVGLWKYKKPVAPWIWRQTH